MDRRTCLTALASFAAVAIGAPAAAAKRRMSRRPIVLYCDLSFPPEREAAMLHHFHEVFEPAARTFAGFIDLKMLKARTLIQGHPLQSGVNYRFQLTYESEELRQLWIHSDTHQRVWPPIEKMLADPSYQVVLFDSV
jgi:hypothetical protein